MSEGDEVRGGEEKSNDRTGKDQTGLILSHPANTTMARPGTRDMAQVLSDD